MRTHGKLAMYPFGGGDGIDSKPQGSVQRSLRRRASIGLVSFWFLPPKLCPNAALTNSCGRGSFSRELTGCGQRGPGEAHVQGKRGKEGHEGNDPYPSPTVSLKGTAPQKEDKG